MKLSRLRRMIRIVLEPFPWPWPVPSHGPPIHTLRARGPSPAPPSERWRFLPARAHAYGSANATSGQDGTHRPPAIPGGGPRDREVTRRSLSDEADPSPGSPARTNTANRARQASQEAARRGITCAKKGGPGQGSIVGCARRSTAPIRCGDASRLAAALSWKLDVRRGSGRRSPAGRAVGVAKRGRRAQGGGGCGSLAARLGREWASSRADLQRTTHGAERAIALCHGRGGARFM